MSNLFSSQQSMPDTQSAHASQLHSSREHRWMRIVALVTMLVTLLPYVVGWSGSEGRIFTWLGYNLDDSCVYLSWMRQAQDGSFRAFNLFTTDPQHGMLLNPFFLVLGWLARFTHLPLIAVYHLARLACGFGLLVVVWEFIRVTVALPFARRLAMLCVCFASGLGWLPLPWQAFPIAPTCPAGPIDLWQPEAITFLSLLLSPLFCFSLALQVAILLLLFKAEQTGKISFALMAGLCGSLLSLTHTYDVLSISAVWIVYLAIRIVQSSRTTQHPHRDTQIQLQKVLLQALAAGLCTLPGVAYIYHELQTEATFQKRANVVTGSAAPLMVLLGYGFTWALAMYAIAHANRKANRFQSQSASEQRPSEDPQESEPTQPRIMNTDENLSASQSALTLLTVWSVTNILVSYLPVSKFPFQRKMLQGAHFPIAILAGCGLVYLLNLPQLRRSIRSLSFAVAISITLLALTNLSFMAREISNYRDNHVQSGQRPYLNPGEIEALRWIEANSPKDTAIQPLPWVMLTNDHKLGIADMTLAGFVPGMIHRRVYCGHWGETPDYLTKLLKLSRFQASNTSEDFRTDLLKEMNVEYLVFTQKHNQASADTSFHPFLSDISAPPYLELVHSNEDADVYKVHLSK